jgi:hypothetical protein
MDEKKTYLVNVESNLAKYAQDAAEAKKQVDALAASNKALKESGEASSAEIEASNASLRNAQKEYTQAKKLVDLQTAANTSNINSRKQLGEIVRIEQLRLGSLANQYTINSKGQRVLSDEYIKASKSLASAKQAIIDYDKAQNDGRSNVGRYGESVKEAFTGIGESLLGFTFGAGAAIAVLTKLKDAFLETESGARLLTKTTNTIKTFFQGIIAGKGVIGSLGDIAVALEASNMMDDVRKKERNDLKEVAQLEADVKMLRLEASKASLTEAQQLEILNRASEKENQLIAIKIGNKQEELEVVNLMLAARPQDTELLNQQAQLEADIITLQADNSLRLANAIATLTEKQIAAAAKRKEIADKDLEILLKAREESRKDMIKMDDDFQAIVDNVNRKKDLRNIELLDLEEFTKKNQDLVDSRVVASNYEREQYITDRLAAADALSAMSDVIGAQTEAGKAFAVAAATINTYVAASRTLADPTIPSTFARVAMMITIIATGLANVKNILKVNTRGGSTPAPSVPTSIPTPRSFAQESGSTILTQPQLSQSQLNSIPNQNILTAEDIANALRNMPAPVVSVEDINARTRSVNKVSVRANI